jgi:nucleoside-diphosphate-sugar epimerase
VVHLAALAHERAQILEKARDYETLRRVNAEGTERLARQSAEAGVKRFVFVSSIGVCGDETFGTPFNEASPAAPRSLYARSKHEAEQRLARLAETTALSLVIVRPTLVYGPGNGGNFLRLLRLVQRGWPLPFAAIRNRRNLTYVDNLVSAISAVLKYAGPERLFIVCDSEPLSTPELAACLASGMKRELLQFPVPGALLRLGGEAARRLLGSLEADNASLKRLTGWVQPVEARAALRQTGAWFCHGE